VVNLVVSTASKLLDWFEVNGRDLPFRWLADPFRILVAGVLLRQTKAAQVASVFPRLVEIYPTSRLLANANIESLKAILKPLGITSRALSLVKISQTLETNYEGKVPRKYDELVKLPGVGDYIASCVLALGYGNVIPMIDVNVTRVFSRIFRAEKDIRGLYFSICSRNALESFHYAVLDLGDLVCKHSNPKCDLCPIAEDCSYYTAISGL